jgi:hypothetical protein
VKRADIDSLIEELDNIAKRLNRAPEKIDKASKKYAKTDLPGAISPYQIKKLRQTITDAATDLYLLIAWTRNRYLS